MKIDLISDDDSDDDEDDDFAEISTQPLTHCSSFSPLWGWDIDNVETRVSVMSPAVWKNVVC